MKKITFEAIDSKHRSRIELLEEFERQILALPIDDTTRSLLGKQIDVTEERHLYADLSHPKTRSILFKMLDKGVTGNGITHPFGTWTKDFGIWNDQIEEIFGEFSHDFTHVKKLIEDLNEHFDGFSLFAYQIEQQWRFGYNSHQWNKCMQEQLAIAEGRVKFSNDDESQKHP